MNAKNAIAGVLVVILLGATGFVVYQRMHTAPAQEEDDEITPEQSHNLAVNGTLDSTPAHGARGSGGASTQPGSTTMPAGAAGK